VDLTECADALGIGVVPVCRWLREAGCLARRGSPVGAIRGGRPGVTGRAPTGIRLNSLYTVHGGHRYTHPGVYQGHVTIRAPHRSPVTVPFTAAVR
jgi:hypothetical protein